jgi:conjugative relaxase-like TrwC/TraI family protein
MLSPKTQYNLRNAQTYFEEHLSVGDYYTEAERITGEWSGEASKALGLGTVVSKSEFLALCENQNPRTGERLTQRLKGKRHQHDAAGLEHEVANRRVFYDFTFSPPKSVSIAALVGNDERIVAAHREAVRIALTELEQFAATRVREKGTNSDRSTTNIVAALFEHETSRALDPHLHTHCIVFNATFDSSEDRWKALQTHSMFIAQKYVENVYYHELARVLRDCGYAIENLTRGDFRITEISPELCERFSKRHREIDEKTRQLLVENPEKEKGNIQDIRRHVAHKERARKIKNVPRGKLRTLWREQLSPAEQASIRRTCESLPKKGVSNQVWTMSASDAVTWAEDHLFDRRSVVHDHEIWSHAIEIARGQASLEDIKEETTQRDYVREVSGRLTRREVLAREWEIVQMAKRGQFQHTPFVPAKLLGEHEQLPEDQREAIRSILGSRNFITLFRGGAGTGKSYVLRRVQRSLDKAGQRSCVIAPQRQQVLDLAKDGLDHTQTVAEFLTAKRLPVGGIVIIDEAGQIGGRQFHELLTYVKSCNGRVILSGDTRQHGPVEASDALKAIELHSGLEVAELTQIRRQDPTRGKTTGDKARISEYRQAVKEALKGDVASSFRCLERLGAVIECTPAEQRERVAAAYVQFAENSESAIIVSQTWAEVHETNEEIRRALRAKQMLGEKEHALIAFERVDLTKAQLHDLRFYPEGHVVIFNRATRRFARGSRGRVLIATREGVVVETNGKVHLVKTKHLDKMTVCRPRPLSLCSGDRLQLKANGNAVSGQKVANGEVVTVSSVDSGGNIRLADGRILPASYRQFVHGYAVTSYGSQGKTVDHVIFTDSSVKAATNAQQWYVTISRGRRSVQIFTADKAQLRESISRTGDRPLALDVTPIARKRKFRIPILRGLRRGRAFAKAVCQLFARKFLATQRVKQGVTV